jgi:hypothetical protein
MVIVFVTVIVTVIVMVVAVYRCPSGRGRRHSRRLHSRRWQYRRGIYDLVYDLLPHEWAKPPIGVQILP